MQTLMQTVMLHMVERGMERERGREKEKGKERENFIRVLIPFMRAAP